MNTPADPEPIPFAPLELPMRLTYPVIDLITFEPLRAARLVEDTARAIGKRVFNMPFKELLTPPFLRQILDEQPPNDDNAKNGLVIFDPNFEDRLKQHPEALPALRTALPSLEAEGINYIIAGKTPLREEFVHPIEIPPLDQAAIRALAIECAGYIQPQGTLFDEAELDSLTRHAVGLPHTQLRNLLTCCAYQKHKAQPYLDTLHQAKAQALAAVGLDSLPGIPVDQIGGLDNLKDFLNERRLGWQQGLPVKGILLAGVPGAGKTLAAQVAASILDATLVRLDMGRFYSKYVGDTEQAFRLALQTIERIAPVVLLIDEMEKFFGQHGHEHEITRRLLGLFLHWLQARSRPIFIVATVNRIHTLPPELIRAGRWDRAFFVDLPTPAELEQIFAIHLTRQDLEPDQFDLPLLAQKARNYTGAEVEQAIIDARFTACAQAIPVTTSLLLGALTRITSAHTLYAEDIQAIRALQDRGFYPASRPQDNAASPATPQRMVVHH